MGNIKALFQYLRVYYREQGVDLFSIAPKGRKVGKWVEALGGKFLLKMRNFLTENVVSSNGTTSLLKSWDSVIGGFQAQIGQPLEMTNRQG